MSHLACHYWSMKIDNILGGSGQKNTQKQLQIIISASRKTFENLKLENYRSNINKKVKVGFSGVIKNNVEFSGGIKKEKNHMEFLGVLVLDKSSKRRNTTLWSFLG